MNRDFFRQLGVNIKNLWLNILDRARPRRSLQWFLTTLLWLLAICYIVFGIYFTFQVYRNHSEAKAVKFAVKIYPFLAATVNNNAVWAKDYYQQLNYIRQFSEKTKQPLPNLTTLRKQIIDQLIENKILGAQAVKYHIVVTKKNIDDAYQKIVDQSGGPVEVKKVLNDLYGMSEKDFKNLIRDQVLKQKIQDELMVHIKVRHIFIKDAKLAKEVAKRAKRGENFTTLAKKYSEDTKSASSGGELGYLAKGQLVVNDNAIPEFDKAAFSAKVGDIVGPVKTSIGYEIIKIEDKKGTVNENFDSWLVNLKKQAKILRFIK